MDKVIMDKEIIDYEMMDKEMMDKQTTDKEIMDKETMEEINLDDEKARMEECIICFDETDKFIVFICNHKTCNKCYPLIMEQRPNCPLCNKNLLQDIRTIEITTVSPNIEISRVSPFTIDNQIIIQDTPCKIFLCICLFGCLLCYILTIGASLYFRKK